MLEDDLPPTAEPFVEPVPGESFPLTSCAVRCSRCDTLTKNPTYMGRTTDGLRMPLWICVDCVDRFGATS